MAEWLPPVVASLVALAAAAMALLSARHQVAVMAAENEANRRHAVVLLTQVRRLDAVERVWRLLWNVETADRLSTSEQDDFVRSLVWFPQDLQRVALDLLLRLEHGGRIDVDHIARLRSRLIRLTSVDQGGGDVRIPRR